MSRRNCTSGKTFFKRAKDAEDTLRFFRKEGIILRTYYCDKCKGHHLTGQFKKKRFS